MAKGMALSIGFGFGRGPPMQPWMSEMGGSV